MPQIRLCAKSRPHPSGATLTVQKFERPAGSARSQCSWARVTRVTRGHRASYRAWQQLSGVPGGTLLFSAAVMARAPYFASVLPHVVRMQPGLAEVRVPKWFFVYNHLHTVHAIASCNAAEVAMGMLMEATVPPSHRWIPKAMTVSYLQKATTSLRARAELEPPDFTEITAGVEIVVPVSLTDRTGTEVVHADITTWVAPA